MWIGRKGNQHKVELSNRCRMQTSKTTRAYTELLPLMTHGQYSILLERLDLWGHGASRRPLQESVEDPSNLAKGVLVRIFSAWAKVHHDTELLTVMKRCPGMPQLYVVNAEGYVDLEMRWFHEKSDAGQQIRVGG